MSASSTTVQVSARALALGAAAAISVWAAPPAEAGLLDQAPKLYTFKLDDPSAGKLPLLAAFHEAELARPASEGRYLKGAWGRWGHEPWWTLAWGRNESLEAEQAPPPAMAEGDLGAEGADGSLRIDPESAPAWLGRLGADWFPLLASTGVSFASDGFDALWAPVVKSKPDWRCRRRPIRFVRYGAEADSFPLLRCDGAAAPEALDRLTLMARPPDVSRPGQLLSDEPDAASSAKGEWAPGVRVVHPRLLWVLQRISDAFPWRTVYIFSGYRPKTGAVKPGSHHSLHGEAKAMDISVMGVPNAALFNVCRTLDDVGCGFYPNSKFVHVDVRSNGSGHPFWIDASGPGEPSRYVDSWPGVIDGGGLSWDRDARRAGDASGPTDDVSCTHRGP
jgi:hypothetical protein